MVAGDNDNGNGERPVPGQIFLRNIYLGQDEDARFARLRNEDTGLEFKCRTDFETPLLSLVLMAIPTQFHSSLN
ncbi:hypothetical protein HY212_02170 [Candidatus Pacearchaeota archaeon]|nr:hypothetical protein [Candidatus Pacearchaeota archaeon]